MEYAREAVERGTHILVCDEILDTLLFKVLQKEQIVALIEKCRGNVELIMTGREAPPELVDMADYVTHFEQIKHPYYKGVKARKGIEY